MSVKQFELTPFVLQLIPPNAQVSIVEFTNALQAILNPNTADVSRILLGLVGTDGTSFCDSSSKPILRTRGNINNLISVLLTSIPREFHTIHNLCMR